MIMKIILLIMFLILCNSVLKDSSDTILDYNFKSSSSFRLDSYHTNYILRSSRKSVTMNIIYFSISSPIEINEISYLYSDVLYEKTDIIKDTLIKVIPSVQILNQYIYTFEVENKNKRSSNYFYLELKMLSVPIEDSAYVTISLKDTPFDPDPSDSSESDYADDSSSSSSGLSIVWIIVIVIVGILALGICIIVSIHKGLCSGCEVSCSFLAGCCECLASCCELCKLCK